MNKLSMVWVFPTVAGIFALTASALLPAQTQPDTSEDVSGVEEKWNFSSQDSLIVAKSSEAELEESQVAKPQNDEAENEGFEGEAAAIKDEVSEAPTAESENPKAVSAKDAQAVDSDVALDQSKQRGNVEASGRVVETNKAEETTEELTSSSLEIEWVDYAVARQTGEAKTEAEKLEASQRRYNLDQQFAKLRKTLEDADSFSLELAEDYFGYGLLLRDDGQYDEAIEAFVDALHIQKVNHGIYSPEQRPALKALFETHYALGNVEDFEDYLERILWVESKNPTLEDDFSYKMLVTVGNRYIDQFLKRPIAGQSSVQTLLRAKHHLNAAYRRHKSKPLSVALMPYGELALISFLESQLLDSVDKTASMEDPRLRGSRNLDGRELALASYLSNSFPRGTGLLRGYLKKAQTEENLPHVVRALVALGDFNQLFRRSNEAREYYKLAWQQAQNLPADHEARNLLRNAVALPAFQYAQERDVILPTKPTITIPLLLDIGADGRVRNVAKGDEDEQTAQYFSRAKRLVRRTNFRPLLIDGEPEAVSGVSHEQRVYSRRGS